MSCQSAFRSLVRVQEVCSTDVAHLWPHMRIMYSSRIFQHPNVESSENNTARHSHRVELLWIIIVHRSPINPSSIHHILSLPVTERNIVYISLSRAAITFPSIPFVWFQMSSPTRWRYLESMAWCHFSCLSKILNIIYLCRNICSFMVSIPSSVAVAPHALPFTSLQLLVVLLLFKRSGEGLSNLSLMYAVFSVTSCRE